MRLGKRTESALKLSWDLSSSAEELTYQVAQSAPEMWVGLNAECDTDQQHQETRFHLVHSLPFLYAIDVPRMECESYAPLYELVTLTLGR